ncbi:hypothetical protein RSOLAG22IIIB_05120 [Rhizoctonia solani]|uniref:Uncharacterized protein n=1 Tax=Rhizoctonia solani TaxID=456999 RepID=A0A0K6G3Q4_9AGAM|nr:hypothetical protein RSOLAG22IIIB_05120 [Rhizoctonia solani]
MISILAIALFAQVVAANPIYRHQANGTTTIQVKETPTATSTINSKLLANATSTTEPITLAVPTSTTAIPIAFSSIVTSVAPSPTEGSHDGSYWSSFPGAEATATATADPITTDPSSTYTSMDDATVIADPAFTDSAAEIPAPTSTVTVRDVTDTATRALSDTELPMATETETGSDVPTATESATGFTFNSGCRAPYYEFPLFRSQVYTGGDPSYNRVVIGSVSGSNAAFCDVITHYGASGNNFLQCDNA